MKRAFTFMISIIMLMTSFVITPAVYANSDVSVYLDGKIVSFEVEPCIINGRTLVPFRDILEAADISVSWDNEARLSVAAKGSTSIWISVDNNIMTVQKGDTSYVSKLEVAPCIISDRTFIPIKPVAQVFDMSVEWDGINRIVALSSAKVSDTPDTINISGFTPPQKITVGSAYSIYGGVSSTGTIDRVNVKVTDSASSRVEINETKYDVNSIDYSLLDIDSRIKFGTLCAGQKLLEITAVTKNETRKVFSYNFEVVKPGGAEIEGEINMLWPVPSSGLLTTIFWCDNPFCHSNAGRVNGHAAIDISAPENSDVIAVKDGVVVKTGFGDSENGYAGYGNFILIDHGDGLTTQYSHLFASYVAEGDTVTAGQIIGGVGNTGNSTGNHLDFNIELNGERCDPLYYLQMHPEARCYEECDKPFFEEAMTKRTIITAK